jgi:hypothetical protein
MILYSFVDRIRLFEKTNLRDAMAALKIKVNTTTMYDPRKRVTTSFKGGKDYCGKEVIIDTILYATEPHTFFDHGNVLYCFAGILAHNRDIRLLEP